MTRNLIFLFILLIPAYYDIRVLAADPDPEFNDEAWLEDDSEFRSLQVNEGKLTFIRPVKDKTTLHSDKVLTITESSLDTGWVFMKQCYFNISPVAATDIVYRYKQLRNFKITATQNIGKADAEGQLVHLYDISADASLCITAEVNVLDKQRSGNFVITSGPYYQQFLDGYYPYHVSLSVNYPENLVRISHTSPSSQPLFKVHTVNGLLYVDTWFEGILNIRIEFQRQLISNLDI